MTKDFFTLLGGFLTALLFFFGTIGVSFDWFTTESINAFVIPVSAFTGLVAGLFLFSMQVIVSRKVTSLVL
ncbi:hypothetical protein MOF27_15785 [Priestia megaterium]|uniref:hypothetical protein n=1 Tax=Priestia megaterium TaxID=1404 RepID=UPI00227DAE95|nr:hypothetical protein [Priestia megaterium]MCY9018880.1 hypothetical protein [Priestia megaterium]